MDQPTDDDLHLFLVHADDEREVLEGGLPLEAASTPSEGGVKSAESFDDDARDPNDLPYQRWGVVVPEGPEGKRLLEIVAPLIKARQEAQGGEPVVHYSAGPG